MKIDGLLFSDVDAVLHKISWRMNTLGYPQCHEYRGGKRTTARAHQLVCDRMFGRRANIKAHESTDHINRNKLDNRREHIRILSTSENNLNRDFFNIPRGESQWKARLTDEDVICICTRYRDTGVSMEAIAKEYKISLSVISKLIRGESWKHVDRPTSIFNKRNASHAA